MSTTIEPQAERHAMGKRMKRKEDPRFIQGRGRYLDDIVLPKMVYLALAHSPYPHARIVKIDKTAALAVPGVIAVLTGEDLREMHTLRAILEGHAACIAADHLTDEDLLALEESCRRYGELQQEDENLPQLVDENFTFHGIITRAAGSERLTAMIQNRTTTWFSFQPLSS